MIDSGATISFIHQNLAQQYNLPLAQHLLRISLANGSTHLSQHATTLVIQSHSQHFSTHTFQLIILGNYAVILGMDWLRAHNPDIDWDNRTVTLPCLHQYIFDKLSSLTRLTMPRSLSTFENQDRSISPPSRPIPVPAKSIRTSNHTSKSTKNKSTINISMVSNAQLRQILKTNQSVGYLLDISRIEELANTTVDNNPTSESKPIVQLPEKYAEYTVTPETKSIFFNSTVFRPDLNNA